MQFCSIQKVQCTVLFYPNQSIYQSVYQSVYQYFAVFCYLDHCLGRFGGFQMFGGVPGEDFDMQNLNLRSKIAKSIAQSPKKRKTNCLSVIGGGIFGQDFLH